ncbi:flagellar protein export ATPase flii, putative [Heliomicrobium modesticaldum Ice1]|uniref:Type 3 secretion system ATPase n=1 Tax=Heliobacterium modesticaldum (strain ATCC 51547 / Ice1) TaxID=498761 RepID=B0THA5_HELMI|nr:flagellar protein export ATPase FliI [Heliomicrobium modesticaldum]ABZ84780.1 flagellar protein export ATPase flii, putative [Heliomicrobium modesticaldum Ice1]
MQKYLQAIRTMDPVRLNGKVSQVIGLVIQSDGPSANLGEVCLVSTQSGKQRVRSEVVGFREGKTLLMPLGEMGGIGPGSQVLATGDVLTVAVGEALLGRVLDGLGNPLDDGGPIATTGDYPLTASPPNPLKRKRIQQPLPLGVKAIDGLLTCGRGQRLGIFAGSGVGKSTLLGMIARNTTADINVIGLIGERGREVREFIEKDLGPEGLARSVVVVATSDQPALVRLKGAFVATAIAEFFRDLGKDVMLMMDSVTRFAMAQREVGLAVGEPPATRGYTPSVFAMLPKLLERSGTSDKGTITGLYTVLVDGDDMNEPIADAVRGILDGHIVLSRDLAAQNHYPAIDILSSVSRVMIELVSKEHRDAAAQLRSVLATYREAKDLIDIGAYQKGANPQIDYSLKKIDACREFLRQDIFEAIPFDETIGRLRDIFAA